MEKKNPEYWRQKIADWKASNQELRLWCRENQVNVKQFCSWKNQFEKEDKETQEPVFAELLSFPNIPDDFNEETLRSLLKVIKQV